MSDKISVYITTHNREKKIIRAVNSVLNQTYQNFEILICDDASTDNTTQVVSALMAKDNRIKYFKNTKNQGACFSRNVCINSATGKFITGLDDDDEFTYSRLETFLASWSNEYSFICSNFLEVYPDKKIKHYPVDDTITFTYRDLLFQNVASNQIFTTTKKIRSINGFDHKVRRLQDWDTWLRLSYAHGKFLRLKSSTYLMNHDHSAVESRVSKAYPFISALRDLGERNRDIYGDESFKCLMFLLKYYERKLSLWDSCRWMCYQKDIRNILRYFKQYTQKDINQA